jgi:bidirectional [NiFe] hydrogenase diaphorase subunit
MITLKIDDRVVEVARDTSLLQACLSNGIYIPHLCFLEGGQETRAACRLCFVDIDGYPAPVPACTVPAAEGLTVHTATPRVRHLQRSALRLLLSVHAVDCKHCHANRACVLQQIARFLTVRLKPGYLDNVGQLIQDGFEHPQLDLYPQRCVLCGRCVAACREQRRYPLLSMSGRGIDTMVRYYAGDEDNGIDCRSCRRCVSACPVGALQWRQAPRPAAHHTL